MSINLNKFTIFLFALMLGSTLLAKQLRPTHRIADDREKVDLELMVPSAFGEWKALAKSSGQIVNPEVQQRLNDVYSQTLSRTYTNNKGAYVMLAIAYGADQSDANQMHYPEVCYPAQGFRVENAKYGVLQTQYGAIQVKRLNAKMGSRTEPVTYWTTVGDRVVKAGKDTKLEKLKYALDGKIPDGLLFRVSTINHDAKKAYEVQDGFINQFVQAITPKQRLRFAGLPKK